MKRTTNELENFELAPDHQPKKKNMLDVILVGGFVAFWLLLQLVILPRFGVRT